jgi:diacylglycerol kinase
MFSLRRLKKSFRHALNGLVYTWRNEQNFRVQTVLGGIVIALGLWLGLSELRMVLVLLLVMTVLVLELLNTFFEKLVDMLSPRIHDYVRQLKDLLAATVLVGSISAFIIGILIFAPYIF